MVTPLLGDPRRRGSLVISFLDIKIPSDPLDVKRPSGSLGPVAGDPRTTDDAVDLIIGQWAGERPDLDVSPIGVIGRISRLAVRFDDLIRDGLRDVGLQ